MSFSVSAPKYPVRSASFTDGYLVEVDPGHIVHEEQELLDIQDDPHNLALLPRFGAFGIRRDRIAAQLVSRVLQKAGQSNFYNAELINSLDKADHRKVMKIMLNKGEAALQRFMLTIGKPLSTWGELNAAGVGASFLHCHPHQPYSSIVYDVNGVNYAAIDEETYRLWLPGFDFDEADFERLTLEEHVIIIQRLINGMIGVSGKKDIDLTDKWERDHRNAAVVSDFSELISARIHDAALKVGKRVQSDLGDDLLLADTDELCSITSHAGLLHARCLLESLERGQNKAALREHWGDKAPEPRKRKEKKGNSKR
ncbi:MAG TPA: hypothetical protein VIT68_04505 [Candidatus Gracilibacteria bacterium]